MLKAKALNQVLSQVKTGETEGALLFTREGLLISYSGFERENRKLPTDSNATISAALLANLWEAYERQGPRSLREVILECEDSDVMIAKVADMLLALKASKKAPVGLLNAKMRALVDYLVEPLSALSS